MSFLQKPSEKNKKQNFFQRKKCQNDLLHFWLLHFRLAPPNRKCNNQANTFHKTCINEGLGQNRFDGVWRREGESVLVSYWYIELNFLVTSSSHIDVNYSSFKDNWN